MKKGLFTVQMLVEGIPVREFVFGGKTYFLIKEGSIFTLLFQNDTDGKVEINTFVDGLSVMDGRVFGFDGRICGCLVSPRDSVHILGYGSSSIPFRLNSRPDSEVCLMDKPTNIGNITIRFYSEYILPELYCPISTVGSIPRSPNRTEILSPFGPSRHSKSFQRDRMIESLIVGYNDEAGFAAAGIIVPPETTD